LGDAFYGAAVVGEVAFEGEVEGAVVEGAFGGGGQVFEQIEENGERGGRRWGHRRHRCDTPGGEFFGVGDLEHEVVVGVGDVGVVEEDVADGGAGGGEWEVGEVWHRES